MEMEENDGRNMLSALDGIKRAPANPFLYEKIRHKMVARTQPIPHRIMMRWAVLLALIVILNVFTWTRVANSGGGNEAESLASQLGFDSSSYQY